jgi:hypothetical protein
MDEGSDWHRDLYLTPYNTHNRQASMLPAGLKTPSPSKRTAADIRIRPRGHWDPTSYNAVRYHHKHWEVIHVKCPIFSSLLTKTTNTLTHLHLQRNYAQRFYNQGNIEPNRHTASRTQNNYYVKPRFNSLAFVTEIYLLSHYNGHIQSLLSMILHTALPRISMKLKILSVYTNPMVYFIRLYFTDVLSSWDLNLHFMSKFM